MHDNKNTLDKAAHTVADLILCERLNELLPNPGDTLGARRFLENAKPVLLTWLESRGVQAEDLRNKAA